MRLVRELLRSRTTPDQAFLLLCARADSLGIPGPAALCGRWFGSRAVVAPTVELRPFAEVEEAFAVPARQPHVTGETGGAVGGGWFGYLSYDLTDPSRRGTGIPKASWGWADHVLRLDEEGRWWFEAIVSGDVSGLASELESVLDAAPIAVTQPSARLEWPVPAEHGEAVKSCVHAIGEGELFQANICTRLRGTFEGQPSALFAEGVRTLAPAKAAYLGGEWGALVSMSPELFLARSGTRVRSTPIKGTLPRRDERDAALATALRKSTKDVAENVMITDLVRNDLGRVCEVGSVRVPELLAVREAPGVWHLDSTVTGVLAPGRDDTELLRATFPPGSVTGAPKLRALDLIAELEAEPRGCYTGAMGLASPVAGLELNVAIRTFEIRSGEVTLGVGGGITADSDPDAEWLECLHKAAPLEGLFGTTAQPGFPRASSAAS
ncbi:aminodeoxychorismate synthase, component I [Prauserella marina]|nr:aminodeoxychorismate synthase component I [Prauserella marina]ASR39700.1 aminodeoxychorismate synthase, component I [Prauserella marina]